MPIAWDTEKSIFFLISPQNCMLWVTIRSALPVPRWGASKEYPQHTILWRNKNYYVDNPII